MKSSDNTRNYALDCVKALATTFILFHHYQQIAGVQYVNHPNFYFDGYFSWGSFDWGWMVELFFTISGFFAFAHLPAEHGTFGAYMGKKLRRLLPVMACSVIVYCALNYLYLLVHQKPWFFAELPNFWGVIVSSLGLQTGWGLNGYHLNNPMWFVSVLIQCYCLTYAVTSLSRKKNWPLHWILAALLLAVLGLRSGSVQLVSMNAEVQRGYISFIVGGLAALFVSGYRITRGVKLLCTAGIASFIWFVIFAPAYMEVESAFVFVFCPALIILLQTDLAGRVFSHRIWQYISEISFNTYVWHSPLQLLLALIAPELVFSQEIGHLYLYALLAWLLGTASYFLLERPLRKWVPAAAQKIFVKR